VTLERRRGDVRCNYDDAGGGCANASGIRARERGCGKDMPGKRLQRAVFIV